MKSLALVLMSLLSVSAFAARVTLHIPLFVEGVKDDPIPMSQFNKEIVKAGKTALPEFFEATNEGERFDFWALRTELEEKLVEYGFKSAGIAFEGVPGEYNTKTEFTCYKGSALAVVDLVNNLTDGPYSDQYTMQGWKYKNKKAILFDDEDGTGEEYLSEESKEWRNYDVNSTDVLILASVGDDGTDVNSSLIPKCK